MKTSPDEATLRVMLYDQVRHVPSLTADIAAYDRAEIGSEDRSYTFLTKAIKRVLERTKHERNRKDIEKSLDNMNSGAKPTVAAVTEKGWTLVQGKKGGKGGNKGKANAVGNDQTKPMEAKAKAAPAKGKGKGKGKGPKLCPYFAAGTCKFGDACWMSHTNPPTITHRRLTP